MAWHRDNKQPAISNNCCHKRDTLQIIVTAVVIIIVIKIIIMIKGIIEVMIIIVTIMKIHYKI